MESIGELKERIKRLEFDVYCWKVHRDMAERFIDYLEAALRNPDFKVDPDYYLKEKPNRILKLVEELHKKAKS